MMKILLLLPFFVQMIAIGVDEMVFHLKRGLPKWERIGHPLDTLSTLACFAFTLFVPFSGGALKIFIALGVLSCLMITKDEFVHKHHCPAAEQWLHALLFVNHSILLFCLGWLWANNPGLTWFVALQAICIALFFLYQVIYWNFIWKPSTTHSTTL